MAFRPQLRSEPPTFPLRVFVACVDGLVAELLRAAVQSDARLSCVERASEAEVIVWDLGPESPDHLASGVQAPRAQPQPPAQWTSGQALLALAPDEAAAAAALSLGASGVLLRRADTARLAAAIVAVRLGLCVLDVALAEPLLVQPAAAEQARAESGALELDALTSREREVLDALALGLSNRHIAERLAVSVHTVKFHVNGILAKLHVDSRSGAVAKALRQGLVRT
jgi:DNA-binding NarL/FixJ family response regulator